MLVRPYDWDNKGEFLENEELLDNLLWFIDPVKGTVEYCPLSAKMTMKKLEAKRQEKNMRDHFQVKRKKIDLRDDDADDLRADEETIEHLLNADDEAYLGTRAAKRAKVA